MLFSVEQAFVGREEIRAPLKTPAWEATVFPACSSWLNFCLRGQFEIKILIVQYPSCILISIYLWEVTPDEQAR